MPRSMATPVSVNLASPGPSANTNVTSASTNHARMVAPVSPPLTALSAPAGRASLARLHARWRRTSAALGPAIHLELLSALIWTTDLSANAETVTRVNVARPISTTAREIPVVMEDSARISLAISSALVPLDGWANAVRRTTRSVTHPLVRTMHSVSTSSRTSSVPAHQALTANGARHLPSDALVTLA